LLYIQLINVGENKKKKRHIGDRSRIK
jgi:hypothetical protein